MLRLYTPRWWPFLEDIDNWTRPNYTNVRPEKRLIIILLSQDCEQEWDEWGLYQL